jgi:hypothetical protein
MLSSVWMGLRFVDQALVGEPVAHEKGDNDGEGRDREDDLCQ